MLELDIENYMQQHNQNVDMNNRAIEDVKYQWEFQLKDLETRHQYEITDFDEITQYNLNIKKEDLDHNSRLQFHQFRHR
mgnify:CR=1 FL=1